MFRFSALLILLTVLTQILPAQVQQSNVYLFDMRPSDDGAYQFSNPRWLTYFNRNGYNNHPTFIEDELLYLSVQMPYQQQPDIFALNLQDTTRARVTATSEGEYSPARMPDFYNFSAVRMEFQGADTLIRLWQFPLNRRASENGRPLFKYLTNIGYYHWLNSQQVAVFLTENPSVLGIANLYSDEVQRLTENVGRTFRTLPNGNLAFVQKGSGSSWELMEMPPRPGRRAQKIIDTLPGSEDFAVLPDGTFLMGEGSKLFKYNRSRDETWVEIADFSYYNISNITRLAVSRDGKIAIVGR